MQICYNKECEFYSKKIIDSCANETLCNISECENYLKENQAATSSPFSVGLCAMQKEITEEINRLQDFIKEPSFSEEEKHTKDLCQAQIPAYKHCLELSRKISA